MWSAWSAGRLIRPWMSAGSRSRSTARVRGSLWMVGAVPLGHSGCSICLGCAMGSRNCWFVLRSGLIHKVLSGNTPSSLFGLEPSSLKGKSLCSIVQFLRDAGGERPGASLPYSDLALAVPVPLHERFVWAVRGVLLPAPVIAISMPHTPVLHDTPLRRGTL